MDQDAIWGIIGTIPLLGAIDKAEYLFEGYSDDKKFILWKAGHPRYLLHLSDVQSDKRRQLEFQIVTVLSKAGIKCPSAHAFGSTGDGRFVYSVLDYLEGESAEKVLPRLDSTQQYAVGREAGRELLKLHGFEHPEQGTDYAGRRMRKYNYYVAEATSLKLSFPQESVIKRYVDDHRTRLEVSPISLQHDDYHPANLILKNGKFAGIIDFNRCDWGDPVEDFHKVPWFTTAVSLPFARGQIDEYLQNNEGDFWFRYNLFVALSLHSSLVWAARHPRNISLWQRKLEEIIETHDWAHSGPPAWYENHLDLINLDDADGS